MNNKVSKKEIKRCLLWGNRRIPGIQDQKGSQRPSSWTFYVPEKGAGWLPGVRVQGLPRVLFLKHCSTSTPHVIYMKCIKFLRCLPGVILSSTRLNMSTHLFCIFILHCSKCTVMDQLWVLPGQQGKETSQAKVLDLNLSCNFSDCSCNLNFRRILRMT